MTYSCCLSDSPFPLVLDTSVLINLHASRHGRRLLSALPNKIIVPNVVELELDNDRSRSTGEYQFVQELITTGAATLASLTDDESVEYLKLVSTLDDGEAATIALAAARGLSPIIDEQKGLNRPGNRGGWLV